MAKICVYGAGSIGCYIGGRLLAAGSEVSFVGRARIGDTLRSQGLTLSRYDDRRWHVPPERVDISTDGAMAAAADLVLVTVKSAATPTAAAELANVLRPGTIVVSRAMLTIDPLARSSMSDDLAAGRATEIDWINGEVVRLAQRLGQTAPVNERLCALVRKAGRSEVRPSWPGEALLAELRAAANASSARREGS